MSDERTADVVRRLRAHFSEVPSERSLSEELIVQRREDAQRENAELKGEITRRLQGSIKRGDSPVDEHGFALVTEGKVESKMDGGWLKRIKEREAKASKGPWRVGPHRGFGEEHDVEDARGQELAGVRGMFYYLSDAEFVAHAREDIPALIGALEGILATLNGVVSQNPDVAEGELVFAGTEEPVRNLIEHLKSGDPLNDFTAHRLTAVTREQTIAYLEATLELVERLMLTSGGRR